MFKAVAILGGCRSSLKLKLAFHSRNIDDVFFACVVFLHHFRQQMEQNSPTDFDHLRGFYLPFSRQLFVFRKSTCRSASPSGKTLVLPRHCQTNRESAIIWLEARNPIPGSGPCQVTGIFSLDENQWSTL
jgi:hypothetical protein